MDVCYSFHEEKTKQGVQGGQLQRQVGPHPHLPEQATLISQSTFIVSELTSTSQAGLLRGLGARRWKRVQARREAKKCSQGGGGHDLRPLFLQPCSFLPGLADRYIAAKCHSVDAPLMISISSHKGERSPQRQSFPLPRGGEGQGGAGLPELGRSSGDVPRQHRRSGPRCPLPEVLPSLEEDSC